MHRSYYVRQRVMMLRKLLACLALLTGLTAGAPAQARVVDALASRIEANQPLRSDEQQPSHTAVAKALLSRPADSDAIVPTIVSALAVAPTVRHRVDRARE